MPETPTNATPTARDVASPPDEVDTLFLQAERSGLKLAIIGRTVTLILLGVWLVVTRADDPERATGYAVVTTVFALLGLAHYALIGSRLDRTWLKFVFVTLDVAIISVLIATQPLYATAPDLPAVTIFRSSNLVFYFVILGVAAFSFSPGLVAWTGVAGALGWVAAFKHAADKVPGVLNWSDIPARPTAAEVLAVLLDPRFGGYHGRIQEAVALVIVGALIAAVMWRARNTLRRQLQAERDRATLSNIFGRFVPPTIADAMVAGRGVLEPVEREATVLFSDIAGFTAMTERAGAARTVQIMNAYFEEMTRIIGDHRGIVTQFHGDAVVAIFNVPVEDPQHAVHAMQAARAMLACVRAREFAGERIDIRIGINTGSLIAGNVGGGGRQSYTVYGDTVNLAARLEALCKEHGTSLLVSAATARVLQDADLVDVGRIGVRGLSDPVSVFSIAQNPAR